MQYEQRAPDRPGLRADPAGNLTERVVADMSKASALVDVGKKRVNPLRELWQNKFLYLLALPAIAYTFIFSYLTLPYIVIAFEKFNYKTGIFSPFVGLANFEYFFKSSWAWTVTRNTLVINILFLLVVRCAPCCGPSGSMR